MELHILTKKLSKKQEFIYDPEKNNYEPAYPIIYSLILMFGSKFQLKKIV